MLAAQLYFRIHIRCITIETNHYRLPEGLHVPDMLVQILKTLLQPFRMRFLNIFQRYPTVHFQTLGRSDKYGEFGIQTGLPAFDVEELFRSQICSETGLRHHIIRVRHSHFCSKYGVASVCDIGKRSSVHDSRCVFRGLYQIGM